MNAKGTSLPILLFLVITVAVLFIFIYRNLNSGVLPNQYPAVISQQLKSTDYAKISGRLELLPEDLKLMILTKDLLPEFVAEEHQNIDSTKYYKAGTYSDGVYKGYTRIIALRPYNNMIGYQQYLFASKDFKTFVLDGDRQKFEPNKKQEELTYEEPRYDLDITKVTRIDMLPSSGPEELALNDKFGLHKDQWSQLLIEQPTYENQTALKLITDLSKFKELPSPNKDFRLFSNVDQNPPKELAKYVNGETTGVYVVDASGLVYKYSQTTAEANRGYGTKLKEYEQQQKIFEQKLKEISERQEKYRVETGKDDLEVTDYPNSPETVLTPTFSFNSIDMKDVILSSGSFFNKYANAFPHPCGQDFNTYVTQNIKDSELQKIGTVNGIDLYLLVDAKHPIGKIAFDLKKKPNQAIWDEMNHKPDQYFDLMPSYEKYFSQRPLLFTKDYWGRTAVLEENNFTVVGGCGKPVVYLYPQTPNDVSIKFSAPMKLETDIPTYANGWKVKAYPDGKLVDLQPKYTKCASLKNSFGSEYAKSACAKNEYPYLYWAGQSYADNYPKITSGWIVPSGEVESILRAKLTEIGLNQKEQNDMLEYWLPQIKNQNGPFYRLSLLQNPELNKLFPMEVSPKPDSVIRVFLDFQKLDSVDEVTVKEQQVQHYNRNGFTLVEWGGLKR